MIYSRWRPDKGGYDYFESAERRGLGDDLPVPQLPFVTNGIGVASTDAGRAPSETLRFIGSGLDAKGAILPLSRRGLAGTGVTAQLSLGGVGMFAVGALLGFWWARRRT